MGSVMDKTIDASVWLSLFFITCYVLKNCVVLLFTSLVKLTTSVSRFLDLTELHRRDRHTHESLIIVHSLQGQWFWLPWNSVGSCQKV